MGIDGLCPRKNKMEIITKSTVDVVQIQSMGGDSMICAAAKVSTNGTEAMGLVDEEDDACPGGVLIGRLH